MTIDISLPVVHVQTVAGGTLTSHPKFLGWIDYQIFLATGLCSHALAHVLRSAVTVYAGHAWVCGISKKKCLKWSLYRWDLRFLYQKLLHDILGLLNLCLDFKIIEKKSWRFYPFVPPYVRVGVFLIQCTCTSRLFTVYI